MSERIPDLSVIDESKWEIAKECLPLVRALANKPDRTRGEVAELAARLKRGITSTYALLRRYEVNPRLTNLLKSPPGPAKGFSRMSTLVEAVIDEAISEVFLTRQRIRVSDLVVEIKRRCRERGIRAPGRKGIESRVNARPQAEIVSRRLGAKAARDQFGPVTGSLESEQPLALVQIDHTLVDVMVVDSVSRAPIQRPWLTLAIDVYTRCVAGLYLSLEPPSATSVALCIAHAALPKEPWLAARGVDHAWPLQGIFGRLHLDNAKEFRSEALKRGCEQYGIEICYRPVRTPHYGGHIERLIGTMMGKVHLLPGTTYSNIAEKGDIDPEKTAAMTLDEVERWLAEAITGVYHLVEHRSLGLLPLTAWRRGADKASVPTAVTDPRRFLIDFLPLERRLVRRDGLSLHSIHYWSDVLTAWIGARERLIVRYDPRDLSRVYLCAPSGEYFDLSYRDVRRPPISLWEHRLAIRRLREEGRANIDENAIFSAIQNMREIAEQAIYTTKAARRQHERRLRLIRGGRDPEINAPNGDETSPPAYDDTRQPWEKMLPVEEWE
jgi:putative transposase